MRTQEANTIHCNDYLKKIGAKFSRSQNGTNGKEYVYHTPTRNDLKPSLCVNLERNIWSDVPAGEGGRLIELVCYTNNLYRDNVKAALAILDQLFPEYRGRSSKAVRSTPNNIVDSVLSLPISTPTSLKEKERGLKIELVREIYKYPLKNYLSERKIPLEVAKKYLKEIEYTDKLGRTFYALAWKCGKTYGLRSKFFKGFAGKGIDISIYGSQSDEVYLFEGIFDYLAYLAQNKRTALPVTAIVMNSVVLRSKLLDWLKNNPEVQRINCYLDNDQSGTSCFLNLRESLPAKIEIQDCSQLYAKFKDYAEWHQAH